MYRNGRFKPRPRRLSGILIPDAPRPWEGGDGTPEAVARYHAHRSPLGTPVKLLLLLALLVFLFICTVPCVAFITMFFAQYR